jgi:hypothetical protein
LINNLAKIQKIKINVPQSKIISFYIKNVGEKHSPENLSVEIIDLKNGTKFTLDKATKYKVRPYLSFVPWCSSIRDGVPCQPTITPVLNLNSEYEITLIAKDGVELDGLSLWMKTFSRYKDIKKGFNPILSPN